MGRDNGQSDYVSTEAISVVTVALKERLGDWFGWLGPSNPIPYQLEDMARDAIELLDELSINKAHVVGHSMGGMIAQIMAISDPDRILSLTIICSSPGPGPGPHAAGISTMNSINNEEFTQWRPDEATFEDIVKAKTNYYKAQSGTMWTQDWHEAHNAERVRRMTKGYAVYLKGSDRHCCAVIRAKCRQGELQELRAKGMRAPVLVVAGALDPIVPPANGELIAALVEDARLELIEGMGHIIVPEACPQLLASFMSHCLNRSDELQCESVAVRKKGDELESLETFISEGAGDHVYSSEDTS